jgi:hypothetical protein
MNRTERTQLKMRDRKVEEERRRIIYFTKEPREQG